MGKYRVEYDREGCIGAAACVVVDSKNWVMVDDGKADLIKGEKKGEIWIKEISEEQIKAMKTAATVCPVFVIKVFDEKGREIAP